MKLAEALALRADLAKRIGQMEERLSCNCRVQEGEIPDENPTDLLAELSNLEKQLEDLVYRINKTNMATVLEDGETLTRKIARRDMLGSEVSILQRFISELQSSRDRYSRNEIKYIKTIDVKTVRQKCDKLSQQMRETDIAIQAANWKIDLME